MHTLLFFFGMRTLNLLALVAHYFSFWYAHCVDVVIHSKLLSLFVPQPPHFYCIRQVLHQRCHRFISTVLYIASMYLRVPLMCCIKIRTPPAYFVIYCTFISLNKLFVRYVYWLVIQLVISASTLYVIQIYF
jgi:hypothetical protein